MSHSVLPYDHIIEEQDITRELLIKLCGQAEKPLHFKQCNFEQASTLGLQFNNT